MGSQDKSALAKLDAAIEEAVLAGLPAGHLQQARDTFAELIEAAKFALIGPVFTRGQQNRLEAAIAGAGGAA